MKPLIEAAPFPGGSCEANVRIVVAPGADTEIQIVSPAAPKVFTRAQFEETLETALAKYGAVVSEKMSANL